MNGSCALFVLLLSCAGPRGGAELDPSPSVPPMQDPDQRIAPPSTEDVDELVYRYQDASVPPHYHRSYSITATEDRILRVVDSYGDEIERQEAPLNPGELRTLLAEVERSLARRATPVEQAGCTGGTGESVTVSRKGEPLFRASVYHCGGKDSGDLVGNASALRDAMVALLLR